ncbi:MAG: hypothetical protein ABIU77_28255, partial [Ferruginibacter sp.]
SQFSSRTTYPIFASLARFKKTVSRNIALVILVFYQVMNPFLVLPNPNDLYCILDADKSKRPRYFTLKGCAMLH